MNWKFWKKNGATDIETTRAKKLGKPKELPQAVGRKMVVGLQVDPDTVWALKYVSRPLNNQSHIHEFRLFHPGQANREGFAVKDWNSLDASPDLILYEGCYDKNEETVDLWPTKKSAA